VRSTEAPSGPIRVVLADDHAVLRAGLRALLQAAEGIEVVAEAGNGEAAVAATVEQAPHVVLMDLSMPGMDGVAATRELNARCPEVAVVVLTSFTEHAKVRAAVDAGAIGYLLWSPGCGPPPAARLRWTRGSLGRCCPGAARARGCG
jgi:DNA-binding NarL/FixJ family response regulator